MSKPAAEYIADAKTMTAELREIQNSISAELGNIRVKIDPAKQPELYKAIEKVFGDRSQSPDKDYITFDMYMICLKIIRAGGKAKAAEMFGGKLVI